MAAGALCLGATNALALAIPRLLQRGIDALGAGADGADRAVARAALLIAACAAAQAAIRTASRILIFNAGRNVEHALRRDLFDHLLTRDPDFYVERPAGDLMSRCTSDLSAVRMLFGPGVLNLLNTVIVLAGALTLLLSMSAGLTAAALLPLPLVVALGRVGSRRLHAASRELQDETGRLATALQEDVAGIAAIRTWAAEEPRRRRFAAANRRYLDRSMDVARARAGMSPIFAMASGLGVMVVLWLGGREVIAGRMSVGELVAFNAYLAYLSWPMLALGWALALWQRGLAAWARVREILGTGTAAQDAPAETGGRDARGGRDASAGRRETAAVGATTTTAGAPLLAVSDLRVRRGDRDLLAGITLELRAGEMVAVVGPTGSGKSTLADAILGFAPVQGGEIAVAGHDALGLDRRALRGLVAYAPQEAFLFSTTVAENIAFGRADGDAAHDDVRQAALTAGLERDLVALPQGIETVIGERGVTLSGGQRQRVALARALVSRAPVLVLDDALSSVDVETERAILARLRPTLNDRATLLVSHRLPAVRAADRIVVLAGGRVVEEGKHDDLLHRGGVYTRLYRDQERGSGARA